MQSVSDHSDSPHEDIWGDEDFAQGAQDSSCHRLAGIEYDRMAETFYQVVLFDPPKKQMHVLPR